MERTGKAEYLIQQAGCGPFQILMVILVNGFVIFPNVSTILFMSFGIYSPGWRCLDNNDTTSSSTVLLLYQQGLTNYSSPSSSPSSSSFFLDTTTTTTTTTAAAAATDVLMAVTTNTNATTILPYRTDQSCREFEACRGNVQFDPAISTIVTEWGLLCDKAWITKLIISIQMIGNLVGCPAAGYLGDAIGRKRTLYGALVLLSVTNIGCMFCPSWQVFAAVRFLLGICFAFNISLFYTLSSEYLSDKYRGQVAPIPFFYLGGVLFGVIVMTCQDWRITHLVTGILGLVCCLQAFWVPESLRWLEVNNKTKEFDRVAMKMITFNKMSQDLLAKAETKAGAKAEVPGYEALLLSDNNRSTITINTAVTTTTAKKYTTLDIFRKGYRLYSIIIGILWFSGSLMFHAISLGVGVMYGNVYVNIILVNALDIPIAILPIKAPNLLGRKLGSVAFFGFATVCLFFATAFGLWGSAGGVKHIGTLVCSLVAKCSSNAGWYVNLTHIVEIYPTVVRSNCISYSIFMTCLGGILAPFLIPESPDTLFIGYAVLGGLFLICTVLIFFLPETRGKNLKETFDDDEV